MLAADAERYIAEVINPNNKYRATWERVPQATEDGKIIKFYGFRKINDASKRLGNIVERYDYSSGKIDKALIENAYQDAVNEIVDFWLSAWLKGGNNVSTMVLAGKEISHVRDKSTVLHFENYSHSQSRTATSSQSRTAIPSAIEPFRGGISSRGGAINPKTVQVFPGIPGGAINPETGQFFPGIPGGAINPETGQFFPGIPGGAINPETGQFFPGF